METDARTRIGGILRFTGLCLVGVMSAPDRPGLAAAVFEALGAERLNVQFIVHSIDLNNDAHIQFCVAAGDTDRVMEIVRPVADALGARKVILLSDVALICVFGPDFRERPGLAGTAFSSLAEAGLNILAVSTSISTISCVVHGRDCVPALDALQRVFALP